MESGKDLKRIHCAYISDNDINKILSPFRQGRSTIKPAKKKKIIFDDEFKAFLWCFFTSPVGVLLLFFLFIKYFC